MRRAAIILAAFTLSACSGESGPNAPAVPNAPTPHAPPAAPASGRTFLWGMVVDASGACIAGAKVLVIEGQRAGESLTQTTPCSVWDYGNGFYFEDLIPGIPMTLRVSAPGYADLERTVTPTLGTQTAFLFTPSRLPAQSGQISLGPPDDRGDVRFPRQATGPVADGKACSARTT